MTLEHIMQHFPEARERKNRYRTISMQLYEDFPQLSAIEMDKKLLRLIAQKAVTYDRQFRKIQEENEDLRGTDYAEKDVLEQEAEIALGYEAGHERKVKELKAIK